MEKAIIVDSSPMESISKIEGLQTVVLLMKNTRISKDMSLEEGRREATEILRKVITDSNTINYIVANLVKCPAGE